ncbi:hypothetical protein ZYGR_0AL01560 [Zygosaccharomyces rouxii]|uniref:Uncharacterized protein n=1 Tax=Zygosaccharomyces rouxii TaxID=4956 RepID=A0A1Q3AFA8_ZYGRO|nr:hypothetical protein ZYGR_0AL01560 [Zygosaccharomyces rouxii]
MLKGSLSRFSFALREIDIEACKHLSSACQYVSTLKRPYTTMNNIIIADFDETITNRDTTCILGQLPYTLDPELKPPWSHFVNVYYEHYQKFQSNVNNRVLPLLPLGKKTIITDTNFAQLFHTEVEFQKSKRLLELASTTEIESHKIFKGVKHEHVRSFVENDLQGPDSLLRPGFSNFISLIPKDNFHVVSVNWSPEFIRHVIGNEGIHPHHIACNSLISNDDEYTGQFTNDLLTGSDKIRVIQQIMSYYDSKENDHCLWYVGDSDTDLLSVLFPNINGVLLIDPVKEPEKFQKITIQLLGLPQEDMDEFGHDSSLGWYTCCTKQGGKTVYIVKSWNDLQKLIFEEN